jgi:tRNA U34 5-methylaminomethyl-2-thiouridine-forming methyltransferase MnmC
MNSLTFTLTSDGSKTLFNKEIGEHYHSRHGALQESSHVFLNSGLKYFMEGRDLQEVSILEVGFGTGLNFLLSADLALTKKIKLDYTGIEAYPLIQTIIANTGYDQYVSSEIWVSFLKNYPSALQNEAIIDPLCKLFVPHIKMLDFISEKTFDIIYFDAFAAVHQPEMWDHEALAHISKYLKKGGIFVTYAITGNLKRSMKILGFSVEKAPGAPGKREMLRAIKS